jgi:hypothetical protein
MVRAYTQSFIMFLGVIVVGLKGVVLSSATDKLLDLNPNYSHIIKPVSYPYNKHVIFPERELND